MDDMQICVGKGVGELGGIWSETHMQLTDTS